MYSYRKIKIWRPPVKATKIYSSRLGPTIARCHRRSSFSLSLSLLGGRFQQHLEGLAWQFSPLGKQQITVSLLRRPPSFRVRLYTYLMEKEWRLGLCKLMDSWTVWVGRLISNPFKRRRIEETLYAYYSVNALPSDAMPFIWLRCSRSEREKDPCCEYGPDADERIDEAAFQADHAVYTDSFIMHQHPSVPYTYHAELEPAQPPAQPPVRSDSSCQWRAHHPLAGPLQYISSAY